jgi:hypothetical protein
MNPDVENAAIADTLSPRENGNSTIAFVLRFDQAYSRIESLPFLEVSSTNTS